MLSAALGIGHIVRDDRMVIIKLFGKNEKNLSWTNLRYFPSIFLKGLRKTIRNLSQDNWSPG